MDFNYNTPLLCDEPKLDHRELKVNGVGTRSLIPNSYTAQGLLEETICSFYGLTVDRLSPPQQSAFARFQNRLKWLVHEDFKDPFDPTLHGHIKRLAKYIDEIFFFGSLCGSSPPMISVELVKQDFVRGFKERYKGWFEMKTPVNGIPQCEIEIAIGATEVRLPEDLLLSLIHEMTHAYLFSFVCKQAHCSIDVMNTIGVPSSNHGPTFRALQFAILSTLSDWDGRIKKLFDYVDPHPLLQVYELEEEERALNIPKNKTIIQSLNPRRLPNPEDCIRVFEGSIIIEIERLRERRRLFN